MDRFLIEVSHEPEEIACARAVKLLLNTGSHFVSHSDWGCLDGVHKGWVVVEAEDKKQAKNMLPPYYRENANIVKLNKFTLEEIEEILRSHQS